jgi:hypothetical protein
MELLKDFTEKIRKGEKIMIFFIEMVNDMFYDGPLGIFLGSLITITTITLLAFMAYGLYVAIDSWFQTKKISVAL